MDRVADWYERGAGLCWRKETLDCVGWVRGGVTSSMVTDDWSAANGGNNMGRTFRLKGDDLVDVPEDATAQDVKEMDSSISGDDQLTYTDPDSGETVVMADEDPVDEIPEGANVGSMPAKGNVYG